LTVVVAVFLGAIRTGTQAGIAARSSAMAMGGAWGWFIGAAVGLVIGREQIARFRGTVIGVLVGVIAGTGAGVLVALPEGLLVIIPGAILLVTFAAAVHRLSRTTLDRTQSPTTHPE
jgi:hypothetical protein